MLSEKLCLELLTHKRYWGRIGYNSLGIFSCTCHAYPPQPYPATIFPIKPAASMTWFSNKARTQVLYLTNAYMIIISYYRYYYYYRRGLAGIGQILLFLKTINLAVECRMDWIGTKMEMSRWFRDKRRRWGRWYLTDKGKYSSSGSKPRMHIRTIWRAF